MLFGKGGGRENFLMGPRHFSRVPTLNLSLQNGEKTKWGEFDGEMTKLAMYNARGQSPVDFFFFFSLWFPGCEHCLLFFKKNFILISWAWCFMCVCMFFFFV